jgi:hypothetical protein
VETVPQHVARCREAGTVSSPGEGVLLIVVLLRVVDCCVVARSFMFYENCAMIRISSDT